MRGLPANPLIWRHHSLATTGWRLLGLLALERIQPVGGRDRSRLGGDDGGAWSLSSCLLLHRAAPVGEADKRDGQCAYPQCQACCQNPLRESFCGLGE